MTNMIVFSFLFGFRLESRSLVVWSTDIKGSWAEESAGMVVLRDVVLFWLFDFSCQIQDFLFLFNIQSCRLEFVFSLTNHCLAQSFWLEVELSGLRWFLLLINRLPCVIALLLQTQPWLFELRVQVSLWYRLWQNWSLRAAVLNGRCLASHLFFMKRWFEFLERLSLLVFHEFDHWLALEEIMLVLL